MSGAGVARIVVIGRAGQVARALPDLGRARADLDILCLGRPELDLAQRDSVATALRRAAPDIIVNAAAYTAVDKAEAEPELAQRVNADGAGWVAQAAAELGAPLIHLSTDYVFDGALGRPYREDDRVNPQNVYGRSKLAGEQAVRAVCPDALILRPAWIYSEHGANFMKTMLRLAAQQADVRVVDDQRGSPTSAADLAAAILELAAARLNGAPGGETFHLAGAGEATWAEVAEAVFAAAAHHGGPHACVARITTADYPTPAKRPRDSRLDCRRVAAAFGIQMPDWRGSIDVCVARLLEQQSREERCAG